MPSSGSVDYTVNALDIINDAMSNIGELAAGETLSSDDVSFCLGKLQRLVKQWQGTADFAPGLKMWSRKRATLFLQSGQASYSLGPSGDHATATYYSTTLDAAELAGQTILSVTSTTSMTAADYIGVTLDDGSVHWSTISSFVAGDTVTIAAGLPSAAARDNRVVWYTTKMRRPLQILTATVRNSDNQDLGLLSPITLAQYESIGDKTADGTPAAFYYESQLTNGVIYLDVEPDDVSKVLRIVYLSPIEDFDASTDTADLPQQWFRALGWQLAMDLAPAYGRQITPELKLNRDESLMIARNADPETSSLFFEPNR